LPVKLSVKIVAMAQRLTEEWSGFLQCEKRRSEYKEREGNFQIKPLPNAPPATTDLRTATQFLVQILLNPTNPTILPHTMPNPHSLPQTHPNPTLAVTLNPECRPLSLRVAYQHFSRFFVPRSMQSLLLLQVPGSVVDASIALRRPSPSRPCADRLNHLGNRRECLSRTRKST
jgi:hypothetical protein